LLTLFLSKSNINFMSDSKLVWSSEQGDLRKKKTSNDSREPVDLSTLELNIRRLTSGKGRTIIEITGLPPNKSWCKNLAKDIKKALGVGGAYKKEYIEVHGEKLDKVTDVLDEKGIKWKKIGG
jgi:translation initiation factor 1